MSLLTGIVAHHNASPGLVSLVANRAYPQTMPQSPVYPLYFFQRISTPERVSSHSGDSNLEQVRYQFTFKARTALEADAMVEAFKAAWLGFAGMMGDVFVSGVTLANDLDDFEPTTQVYGRFVDVMLWTRPER